MLKARVKSAGEIQHENDLVVDNVVEVIEKVSSTAFRFKSDMYQPGEISFAVTTNCSHLRGGDWELFEEEESDDTHN